MASSANPRRIVSLLVGLALAVGLLGCGRADVDVPAGMRTEREIPSSAKFVLEGAGATFPAPLYEDWFLRYHQQHPEVWVDYDANGSGAGERLMLEGAVDFAGTDAGFSKLSDEELEQKGLKLVPASAGSIVVVYNLGRDHPAAGRVRLSRQNLVDIFLGRLTSWNAPELRATNPGIELPDLPISVVVRRDASGTTFGFTSHLDAISPVWAEGPGKGKTVAWPGAAMSANGNGGVAGLVKRTPGAVGYVTYGFVQLTDLPGAILQNRAGNFVAPTAASGSRTIAEARLSPSLRAYFPDPEGAPSYPIVGLTWLVLKRTYESAEKAARVRDVLTWCLQSGQEYSESKGYLRLPPSVVAEALEAVRGVGP